MPCCRSDRSRAVNQLDGLYKWVSHLSLHVYYSSSTAADAACDVFYLRRREATKGVIFPVGRFLSAEQEKDNYYGRYSHKTQKAILLFAHVCCTSDDRLVNRPYCCDQKKIMCYQLQYDEKVEIGKWFIVFSYFLLYDIPCKIIGQRGKQFLNRTSVFKGPFYKCCMQQQLHE